MNCAPELLFINELVQVSDGFLVIIDLLSLGLAQLARAVNFPREREDVAVSESLLLFQEGVLFG